MAEFIFVKELMGYKSSDYLFLANEINELGILSPDTVSEPGNKKGLPTGRPGTVSELRTEAGRRKASRVRGKKGISLHLRIKELLRKRASRSNRNVR